MPPPGDVDRGEKVDRVDLLLSPGEVLGSAADPDAASRPRWPVVAGGVALALVAAVVVVRQGDTAPDVVPVPSASAPDPSLPTVPLSLTTAASYVRVEPSARTSLVVLTITNDDVAPLTLTSATAGTGARSVPATVVSFAAAQQLVTAPDLPGTTAAVEGVPVAGLTVPVHGQAAVVLTVTPDCASQAGPAPAVTVQGSSVGPSAPGSADLGPVQGYSSGAPSGRFGWWNEAVTRVCSPGARDDEHDTVSTTRRLDGLELTTTGPVRPALDRMFTVDLTATNMGTSPYRGWLGVELVDHVKVGPDGSFGPQFLDVDTIDPRGPRLTSTGFAGLTSRGIAPVGSGAALQSQRLEPGESRTITFYLRSAGWAGLLGPTHGWVPTVFPNGDSIQRTPDAGSFPVITLPRGTSTFP